MVDKSLDDVPMTHEGPQQKNVRVQGAVKAPKRQRTLVECYATAKPCSAGSPAIVNMMCEGTQEQGTPKGPDAEVPLEPTAISLPIKFMTWNVMGLTTLKEELSQLVEET